MAAAQSRTLEELSSQLDDAQDRVMLALDACGAGVWDWDIVADKLYWDAGMMRLFGVSSFGGTYADFERCLDHDDAIRVKDQLMKAIETRAPFDYSFRLVSRPGVIIRGRGKCYYRLGVPVRFAGVNIEETATRPPRCPISYHGCPSRAPTPL